MTTTPDMKIKALAPWFGGNRDGAASVGTQLGELSWCGVPFAGGCPELPAIQTRGGVANDKHRHIINLARVIADDESRALLAAVLHDALFHPDVLADAQRRCIEREGHDQSPLFGVKLHSAQPLVGWAADYFICCWMGRGGHSGKQHEFTQGLSLRWTSSGGDSARRYMSAIESLDAWGKALRPWSFSTIDAFDFLAQCRDEEGHGIYVDAPWPEAGEEYRHKFTDAMQARMAERLGEFRKTRVVIRFGEHPLIAHLYPESRWTWIRSTTRNQKNNAVSEVLIVNGPEFSKEGTPCSSLPAGKVKKS